MLSPAVDGEPVSTAQARVAWETGVAPLLEAFPDHAGDILRTIAFAHRAPFPVPVFITGRPGAGKTTLARAIGELTGRSVPLELPQRSLASIRKAATPGSRSSSTTSRPRTPEPGRRCSPRSRLRSTPAATPR